VNRYRAYGLIIKADVALPEMVPAGRTDRGEGAIVVRIRRHRVQAPTRMELIAEAALPDGGPWRRVWRAEHGFVVTFANLARFFLAPRGAEIVCTHRSPGVAIRSLRHLVLDQLMPLVLSLRGREALHSTAIATARGVCAFIGPAGAGKSTLVGSFCREGYVSLADDCLSVADRDGICAFPAYPGLRLWGDSGEALGSTGDDGPTVAHYTLKRRAYPIADFREFPFRPIPVAKIYRLERASGDAPVDMPKIEPISPRDALLELVQASFPLDITDSETLARHFRFMERVAETVPISRLVMPHGFDQLPRVREAVLRDIER
jgi:hypothetical protein